MWLGFTVWEILVFKAVYLKCICEIEYSKSGSESQDQIWWNLVIEVQQMKSDKTKSGRNYADNFFCEFHNASFSTTFIVVTVVAL